MIAEKLVLCVDANNLFLRMLTSYLQAFGYTVVPETSGRKAVETAAARTFHAVILDCLLPDFDGGEVALQINQLQPETAILILTGSAKAVPARVAALAGAVLCKENGLDALISALEHVPDLPRPKMVRKFVRYPVHLPFILKLMSPNSAVNLRGTTTSVAEGGLGAKLEGEVYPGEDVLIEFQEPQLLLSNAQARVRYRSGDIYGFEFCKLDSRQQASLRESFERLAAV